MPEYECIVYLENWVKFENMAVEAVNSEINVKRETDCGKIRKVILRSCGL